jgi:nitrogen regulatory protein PII
VNAVVKALEIAGARGLTVTNVSGRGANAPMGSYRGAPYPILLPMCAVEVITSDEMADRIAQTMLDGARTGHAGDGHVCVLNIEGSYPIRARWPRVA